MKTCTVCEEDKDETEFYSGQSQCKQCRYIQKCLDNQPKHVIRRSRHHINKLIAESHLSAPDRDFARRQRKVCAEFALAEVYAKAAGQAASLLEQKNIPKMDLFNAQLMAKPHEIINMWIERENK